jgi:hypothetical protein
LCVACAVPLPHLRPPALRHREQRRCACTCLANLILPALSVSLCTGKKRCMKLRGGWGADFTVFLDGGLWCRLAGHERDRPSTTFARKQHTAATPTSQPSTAHGGRQNTTRAPHTCASPLSHGLSWTDPVCIGHSFACDLPRCSRRRGSPTQRGFQLAPRTSSRVK